MKRFILFAAFAALFLSSCVQPEFPEGDSACTLSALKVWVYDAERNVLAKDLNALGGMYDAESGERLKDIDFADIEAIGDMTTDELIDWLADNEI